MPGSRAFTRRDALAAGLTVKELATPRVRRLFHNAYVQGHVAVTARARAEAALRIVAPGSRISHHSAAILHGGWAPPDVNTHVTVPVGASRSEARGITAHRELRCGRSVTKDALRLSAPADVLLELARVGVGLVDLVAAGDALLRAGALALDDLRAATATWEGPGVRRARRAVGYVREGVDSIMESRLRMLLVLAGLPEPVVNFVIRHEDGSWRWRFDLCYPDLKLIIEYDGRQHAADSRQWNSDLRRREELERDGWSIIVVTAAALFGAPREVIERVRRGIVSAGGRQRRREPSAEWRRLFETSAA